MTLKILVLLLLTWSVDCANILVVFLFPAHSHFSLGFRIAKELVDRNHQVTFINPYPQKNPIKNLRDVSTENLIPLIEDWKREWMNPSKEGSMKTPTINDFFNTSKLMIERTLLAEGVQNLLHSHEKFDVVVMEYMYNDAAVAGLGHTFGCPVVLVLPVVSGATDHLFANPAPSSYVPGVIGTQLGIFTKHMNFWERTLNFLFNIVTDAMGLFLYMPMQNEIFKKHFHTDLDIEDVLYKKASLMLVNTHVSMSDAVPRVPGIIEIGGAHVNPPKKLPDELQKFLDDSKQGVVLFSLGSNLNSKDLKSHVRDGILQAFSKIKQNVLWKFEEDLPNLPKNVKIMKWLPQQDVLAHPNVQAFITHGGLLSTIESVYYGVPLIGVPAFADQKSNIANAVANGHAVTVPFDEMLEDKISWALNEVLNNPKYRANAKWRSSLMHDQPLKPLDSAMYWIEHVIRHKGAPHLKSAGLDLKWYERYMIDIVIFLSIVTITLVFIFYKIIKSILNLCCSKKKLQVTKAKKNK